MLLQLVCRNCILAPQLIHNGKLDFLVFDYLSEITMSLLTAAKLKNPVSISKISFYSCILYFFIHLVGNSIIIVVIFVSGLGICTRFCASIDGTLSERLEKERYFSSSCHLNKLLYK